MLQKALVEAPNVGKRAAASRSRVETPRRRRGTRRPFPAESRQRIAVAARSLLRSLRPRARRGIDTVSISRGQDSAGLAPKAAAAAQDRRRPGSPLTAPVLRGTSVRRRDLARRLRQSQSPLCAAAKAAGSVGTPRDPVARSDRRRYCMAARERSLGVPALYSRTSAAGSLALPGI